MMKELIKKEKRNYEGTVKNKIENKEKSKDEKT